MPALLLQILLTPILASIVVFVLRHRIGRFAGWVTSGALLYTTVLVLVAAAAVSRGKVLVEEYRVVAPNIQIPEAIRLGLLADGLSISTLAVVMLLCAALAIYSIRYIERRIENLYADEDQLGRERLPSRVHRHNPEYQFDSIVLFHGSPHGRAVLLNGLFRLSGTGPCCVHQFGMGDHRGALVLGGVTFGLRPNWELEYFGTQPHEGLAFCDCDDLSVSCWSLDETGDCAVSRLDASSAC